MEVNGPGSLFNAFPVRPTGSVPNVEKPAGAKSNGPNDDVEISAVGKMFNRLSQSPKVRAERLTRIKAEIDAGIYETPEKLEAALLKMMNEIGLNDEDDG